MENSTDIGDINVSVVRVYFGDDSVHAKRRSARYSLFEQVGKVLRIIILINSTFSANGFYISPGLVGGTVSMITGITLLDVIEAVVLFLVIVIIEHKAKRKLSSMGGPQCKCNK